MPGSAFQILAAAPGNARLPVLNVFKNLDNRMTGGSRSEFASTWHIVDTCEWSQVPQRSAPKNLVQGGQKKVSHYHEPSLNRIKTRH